jgi:hypothetical protein
MAYTAINLCAYLAAFSGAISGMTVGGGWITDPTAADYSNLTDIAGKYAQAIDQAWNNSTPLTSLEKDTIREISVQLFVKRGAQPAAFSTFHTQANWTAVAAGVVALTHQCDTYVASEGVGNNQTNGQVQRARGVTTGQLVTPNPVITLVDPPNNDGITYALSDTVLAIGNGGEGGNPELDGPWIITTVNAGVGTLTRPPWWPHAATLETSEIPIEVGSEGAVFSNTRWRAMGPNTDGVVITPTNTFIVDTDDPGIYPEMMTFLVTLNNGETTTTAPVLSISSGVAVTDADVRPATTTFYQVTIGIGGFGSGGGITVSAITAAGILDGTNSGHVLVTLINQSLVGRQLPGPQ